MGTVIITCKNDTDDCFYLPARAANQDGELARWDFGLVPGGQAAYLSRPAKAKLGLAFCCVISERFVFGKVFVVVCKYYNQCQAFSSISFISGSKLVKFACRVPGVT